MKFFAASVESVSKAPRAASPVRVALARAHMLAYFAILFTALAAFFGAPVWTALIGASVLFAISYSEQRKFAARFARVSATGILTVMHWQSAGHALLATGAAFALGSISRFALTAY